MRAYSMHVLVVLRLIPDLVDEIEITQDGKGIDREWIDLKLNEFDDHALEEAVLLKESDGVTVTAIALDGEGVNRLLQSARARGADRAAKIVHDIPPPVPAAVAAEYVAAAIESLGCDLVFTGVQTTEDLFGQLAPTLAARLGWRQVSATSAVKLGGQGLLVQQEYSGGFVATLSVSLPAVLGIQAASRPPRYVSGTKLREALSAKIDEISVAVQPTPQRSEIVSLGFPESSGRVEMIEGTTEAVAGRLAAILRDRGLVKR
jgi:electron transfer flavoprotein beta subunit